MDATDVSKPSTTKPRVERRGWARLYACDVVDKIELPLEQAIVIITLAMEELDVEPEGRNNEMYLAIWAGIDLLKKAREGLKY